METGKIIAAPIRIIKAPFVKIARMYAIERNVARIGSPRFKGTDADRLKLINSTIDLCRRGSRNYARLLLQRRTETMNTGYDQYEPGARIEYLKKMMEDSKELMHIRPKNGMLQDAAESAENAYFEALRDTTPRKMHAKP